MGVILSQLVALEEKHHQLLIQGQLWQIIKTPVQLILIKEAQQLQQGVALQPEVEGLLVEVVEQRPEVQLAEVAVLIVLQQEHLQQQIEAVAPVPEAHLAEVVEVL